MADRLHSNEPPHDRAETARSAYWAMDPYAITVGDAWYVESVKDTADHELALLSRVLQHDGEPWWDVYLLLRLDRRFDEAAAHAAAGAALDADDGRS